MTKKAKGGNFVCLQTTITRSLTHASSNGGRTSRQKKALFNLANYIIYIQKLRQIHHDDIILLKVLPTSSTYIRCTRAIIILRK